jgi:hypothetical protein
VYGNFCIKRAVIAIMGLGANSAGDAVYPILMVDADGNLLAGDYDHVLHFGETGLRPVHSFWSAAMYDIQAFRPRIPSAASRSVTAIRCSTSTTLAGLDLYLQHKPPGAGKEANWLPRRRARSASQWGSTPRKPACLTACGCHRPWGEASAGS